jgi:hypothetical protein
MSVVSDGGIFDSEGERMGNLSSQTTNSLIATAAFYNFPPVTLWY